MADENDKGAKVEAAKQDVVLMHSRTDDGEGIRVIRAREGRIEAGELRALKHGVPIAGEVVSLTQRSEQPALWDVKVQCSVASSESHAGPARVASRAYRRNWDGIFKSSTTDTTDDESLPN